jgi:hypothetical protein
MERGRPLTGFTASLLCGGHHVRASPVALEYDIRWYWMMCGDAVSHREQVTSFASSMECEVTQQARNMPSFEAAVERSHVR